MSQYPANKIQRAVVADGDAWQEWAVRLDNTDISLAEARKIADLAVVAITAHEHAYAVVGKQPPPAFRRRPDQQ